MRVTTGYASGPSGRVESVALARRDWAEREERLSADVRLQDGEIVNDVDREHVTGDVPPVVSTSSARYRPSRLMRLEMTW